MEHIKENYVYTDSVRSDILHMIPEDGKVIGSIGCGQAKTEELLVKSGREVHGADVSAQAIEVAKQRLTSAKVIGPDELMPFPENSLDGLILADVLEHLPLAGERLANYAKMVKKGGWVVISVPNMRQLQVLYRLVIKGDWPERDLGVFDKTHIQIMTDKRLLRWAKDAGLSLAGWYDSYQYILWPINIYKIIDLMTFRFFRSFLHYQLLAVFRRS